MATDTPETVQAGDVLDRAVRAGGETPPARAEPIFGCRNLAQRFLTAAELTEEIAHRGGEHLVVQTVNNVLAMTLI